MALEVYLPQGRPEFVGLLRAAVEPRVRLHVGKRPDPASYEVLVAGRPAAEDVSAASGLRAVVIPWDVAHQVKEAADLIARREGVIIEASQEPGFNMARLRKAWGDSAEVH